MDNFEYKKIEWKVPIERSLLIDKRIDHPSLRLYLILLSYARDKVTAFPSRETLAKDMDCGVRNIDLIKNKLQKLKLLDWVSKYNGSNKYNIYSLLQYEPLKRKQRSEQKTVKDYKQTEGDKFNVDTKMQEVIDIFRKSYEDFCNDSDEDLKDMIQSGWVANPNYFATQGDIRNLTEYSKSHGDAGMKKLGISFRFLGSYLRDAIEYGDFHTNQGAELVPTISLFVKAKFQHDKIMKFTLDELRRKASQDKEAGL